MKYEVDQFPSENIRQFLKESEEKQLFKGMVNGTGNSENSVAVTKEIKKNPKFAQGPGRFGFGGGKVRGFMDRNRKDSMSSVVATNSVLKFEESVNASCHELRSNRENKPETKLQINQLFVKKKELKNRWRKFFGEKSAYGEDEIGWAR